MTKPELLARTYDEIRTARMNWVYHGWMADRALLQDRGTRIVAALTGSASIAGFAIWRTDHGSLVWALLTAAAAIANIYSAVFVPAERARKAEDLRQRYNTLRFKLEELRVGLQSSDRKDGDELRDQSALFMTSLRERGEIQRLEDRSPNRKLLERAQQQVNSEEGTG